MMAPPVLRRVTPSASSSVRVTALVLAHVALVATACQVPPIDPANRPRPVAGHTNGSLPANLLVEVTPQCQVYAPVAPYLRAMLDAAHRDGVRLQPVECYRPYELQFFWRWYWCTKGACQMAAVPGTSIHGWGKAADFRDQNGSLTFSSPGFGWLQANAWRYGWNHPGWAAQGQPAAEAWHWEWVGDGGTKYPGVTVPRP